MNKEKKAQEPVHTEKHFTCDWFTGKVLAGMIVVIVGLGLLLQNLFPGSMSFNYAWPLIIIVVGIWLILRQRK